MRLLRLSYEEQRLIVETGLTERHARALLKVEDQALRIEIIKCVSANKLNVLNTEQYIENLLKSAEKTENSDNNGQNQQIGSEHKAMNDFISSFQRKVDAIKKLGKDASISVLDGEKEIDVHIKILKI